MKLIDTDIAIDHFHGQHRAFEFFTRELLSGERLGISVISLAEILAGMREGEQNRTEQLFGLFEILDVNEAVARKAEEYIKVIALLIALNKEMR